jgi:hypothetical protein
VTKDARRAARFLTFPNLSPLLRVPYGVLAAAAISLLPVRDRIALRLPSFPPAEPFVIVPATRAFLGAVGVAMGPSPAYVDAQYRLALLAR